MTIERRVEEVDDAGQHRADASSRRAEERHRDRVAERRGPGDVLGRHDPTLIECGPQPGAAPVLSRGLACPADRRSPGERLETADVAAAAHDGRIVGDLDVTHVAGAALCPAMQVPVRDDPGADPGPDLDHDHVGVAGGDTGAPLPEGQDIDVVVDPDRGAVARGEPLADRVAVPAGHDRRRDRPARPEFDRPRDADADPPQPTVQIRRRPQQRVEQGVHAVEALVRSGLDPGGLVVMPEDPAVEGRDRHVDARRPEVGDQDVTTFGVECQLARRPAAGARPDIAFADQPAFDQLTDPLGDGGAAEAGPGDQLGARPGPPITDLVEDHHEGVERLVGERPERPGVAGIAVRRDVLGRSICPVAG